MLNFSASVLYDACRLRLGSPLVGAASDSPAPLQSALYPSYNLSYIALLSHVSSARLRGSPRRKSPWPPPSGPPLHPTRADLHPVGGSRLRRKPSGRAYIHTRGIHAKRMPVHRAYDSSKRAPQPKRHPSPSFASQVLAIQCLSVSPRPLHTPVFVTRSSSTSGCRDLEYIYVCVSATFVPVPAQHEKCNDKGRDVLRANKLPSPPCSSSSSCRSRQAVCVTSPHCRCASPAASSSHSRFDRGWRPFPSAT